MTAQQDIRLWPAIVKALRGKCPQCGKAPLFRSYLKQVDHCAHCHAAWGDVRADDAPPWLTILIVGHIMAPFLTFVVQEKLFSMLTIQIGSVVVALALIFLILPRAKALFIAVIWATRAGSAQQ